MSNNVNVKDCTRCKQMKSFDEFRKNPLGRFELSPRCKQCDKEYQRERWKKNPEQVRKWQQKYLQSDKGKQTRQEYIKNNLDTFKANQAKYHQTERYKKWKLEYDRKLRKDPVFRLGVNLRGNMYHALKAMKGFRRWRDLVGYGLEELSTHLEGKFVPGISWDNYGSIWHVDHIVPKSWFKYTSTDDPKFKECWALSNLQPKLKRDNQSKGNRFVG